MFYWNGKVRQSFFLKECLILFTQCSYVNMITTVPLSHYPSLPIELYELITSTPFSQNYKQNSLLSHLLKNLIKYN